MNKRLLVVDDEKDYTAILRFKLERLGHRVEEANSGRDARARLSDELFDLVFLDYLMPDMKGDEVCRGLREDERYRHVPVIIVTACRDRDVESFLTAGADAVIHKPIDNDELARTLDDLLAEGPRF